MLNNTTVEKCSQCEIGVETGTEIRTHTNNFEPIILCKSCASSMTPADQINRAPNINNDQNSWQIDKNKVLKIAFFLNVVLCIFLVGFAKFFGNSIWINSPIGFGFYILSIISLGIYMQTSNNSMPFIEQISNFSKKTIESKTNEDGVVVGKIEAWPLNSNGRGRYRDVPTHSFRSFVKRTYQSNVYLKEREFDTLEEAQRWLKEIYPFELEKHLAYKKQNQLKSA